MHGLVNRSIQWFVRDTYGVAVWDAVARDAGIPPQGFEALLTYDDALTYTVIASASVRLGKPRDAFLEDLGAYLAGIEALRRLMRFSGVDFSDFILSLDELPDRVRLAVPDLEMPELSVLPVGEGRFRVSCKGAHPGYGAVFAGVLRAMADDYGVLALIDSVTSAGPEETVSVELLETRFAAERRFDLARPEV